MKHHSYDVLTEPWIAVARLDGSRDELGIRSCLEQAHELREIRDPAPIIEFGMYRLLVAFILDALISVDQRPEGPLDLKSLLKRGRFNTRVIRSYIARCGDVFDLFHPERPFLQTNMKDKPFKPLAGMFPATPSGTNVSHWHHLTEDTISVTAGEAVKFLTTIAPFMTAGGAGLSPSINGAPAIYALSTGNNLFETLVLNIPLRKNQESGNGVIAWKNRSKPGKERSKATTVEALTWRPRQIQLIPEIDKDGHCYVRKMKFEKGDSTRLAAAWIDSNLAYRYNKDKITPVRMRENRPVWRDAGPLLLLSETEKRNKGNEVSYKRPDVVEHAFLIIDSSGSLVIQVYGMRTDMKMKVFEWSKSTWAVPSKLGRSTRLGSLVHFELDRAEMAAYGLRTCIKALYPRGGAGNEKALRTISDRCERTYWQRLESSLIPLMNDFAALDPDAPDDPELVKKTADKWRKTVYSLAFEQFEFAAEDMDADSDSLERQVNTRSRLNNTLRKVLS